MLVARVSSCHVIFQMNISDGMLVVIGWRGCDDRAGSVGGKAKPAVRVEAVNRSNKRLEGNLLQVFLGHSPVSVAPGKGNGQALVRDHEVVSEFHVSVLGELEEALIYLISGR